jgi:hypothetical protein
MFRARGLLAIVAMVSALVLSACGPAGPTPVPLSAIEVPSAGSSSVTSFVSTLPWANDGTKVSDGPYAGYKIEGPNYYNFFKTDLTPDALNAFYVTKLTAAGWTQGVSDAYLNGKLGVIESGQPWVKGNQVIYLVVYQNPAGKSTYILAIYSLTK